MMKPEIKVLPDPPAVAREAAERIVFAATNAISTRGRFSIALAGGSTPKATFELLASDAYRSKLDWSKVDIFFGDERCVPVDHKDSNYRMAREALLSKLPIPSQSIYRMRGEIDPESAAKEYGLMLKEKFPSTSSGQAPSTSSGQAPSTSSGQAPSTSSGQAPSTSSGQAPSTSSGQAPSTGSGQGGDRGIDLVMLGMGDDGHTLSLFPGTKAVTEREHRVVANYAESSTTGKSWRITMTAPFVNKAAMVLICVTGAGKAARIKEVLEGPAEPERLPIQLIRPTNGQLVWLLDVGAASKRSA